VNNEYELLKEMGGIREEYLLEAENAAIRGKKKLPGKNLALILVIVLAVSVPVGAAVYQKLTNKNTVEYFFKNSDLIEEKEDAVRNIVWENEKTKVTVDAVLSDGRRAVIVMTCEAKGREDRISDFPDNTLAFLHYAEDDLENTMVRYSKEGELPRIFNCISVGSQSGKVAEKRPDMILQIIDLKDVDLNRTIQIDYLEKTAGEIALVQDASGERSAAFIFSDEYISQKEGLTLTENLIPNVRQVLLKSADGRELILSEYELYVKDTGSTDTDSRLEGYPYFIKNNGEKIRSDKLFKEINSLIDQDYIFFGSIIDLDEYKGVELNDIEYLKEE